MITNLFWILEEKNILCNDLLQIINFLLKQLFANDNFSSSARRLIYTFYVLFTHKNNLIKDLNICDIGQSITYHLLITCHIGVYLLTRHVMV